MWPPVLPFVKAAVVAGTVSGAGDSVLQWARGLQYSRVKRRGRIDSWDAIRSTQVAIVAAAVGPILVVPTVLAGPGLEDLLSAAAGIALVEAGLLPFFYCWREDLLFSFKSNIPRLVVIGTTYTLGISLVTAYSLDHLPSLTSLGQLGALMPEGVVWTAGLGLTAFFLYAFAHQTALSMETNLGKDRDPLIGRAKLVGVLCSASLLGLVVLDMPEFPLAHLFLTDVFWMSGMVYQCFLTYIQSLETERSKAQAKASKGNKGGFDVAAHLRLRTLLNVAMVGGTLAYRPFESSGQESVAMGLKGFVSLCWLAYFLTFDKEYEPFDGDAGNWALVSTDEEERARRRRRQTKAEHAAQRREPKEKRKAEREAQQREAEKVPESSTPPSSTDPESAEDDAEGVERGHRRGGESGRKAAAENSSSRPTTAGRPASDGGGRSGLRTTPGGRRPRTGERPAPLRKGSPPPSSPSSR
eukprot:EG_transcript_10222